MRHGRAGELAPDAGHPLIEAREGRQHSRHRRERWMCQAESGGELITVPSVSC